MPRILSIGGILLVYFGASSCLVAQTPEHRPDTRLDEAMKEIALLTRMVTDQDRRIAGLEKTVKSLQAAVFAATRPVSPWRTAEGWAAVKLGMSRAQVVETLGEPRSTDSVIDRQTLFYKDGNDPVGNVVITDDRVSEVVCPRFQIYLSPQK